MSVPLAQLTLAETGHFRLFHSYQGDVVWSFHPLGRVILVSANVEDPSDRPLWPGDVLATVYRVLGIDPESELPDAFGRPIKLMQTGEPIRELLGG